MQNQERFIKNFFEASVLQVFQPNNQHLENLWKYFDNIKKVPTMNLNSMVISRSKLIHLKQLLMLRGFSLAILICILVSWCCSHTTSKRPQMTFLMTILDSNFTSELTEPIGNGNSIYAQSELMPEAEAIADLQLVTCVSAPGPIENMAPTGSVSQFGGHYGTSLGFLDQSKGENAL